jgi:hypothetical protein
VKESDKTALLGGIQRGAAGVKVTKEGNFRDIGKEYYDESASVYILSFASQIDSGADISYDRGGDRFIMTPASGNSTYYFSRKNCQGSEGRFYVCDSRTMIEPIETVLVQTVENNMRMFSKREVHQARKAREALARMGFPSVAQAIRTASSGSNFDVTARDFEIADVIWGKDIASMKGKTKKQATPVANVTISSTLVQKEQVLAIDLIFVRKLAILIGVSSWQHHYSVICLRQHAVVSLWDSTLHKVSVCAPEVSLCVSLPAEE